MAKPKFWQALLGSSGPTPELIGAFVLGLLIVAIVGNLAYDLLVVGESWWVDTLWVLGATLALIGAAYGLYWLDGRRVRKVQVDVDESRLSPPHAGLIWLFGPGRFDHLLSALKHHLDGGGAEHCWLVMQNVSEVRETFARLSQTLHEEVILTELHPMYIPELDAQAAYSAVRDVFDHEAGIVGLQPAQVIADITGGTKPLTAGMVLATIAADRQMEYVETDRDSEGKPIPDTLRVVLINAGFSLSGASRDSKPE